MYSVWNLIWIDRFFMVDCVIGVWCVDLCKLLVLVFIYFIGECLVIFKMVVKNFVVRIGWDFDNFIFMKKVWELFKSFSSKFCVSIYVVKIY